MPNCIECGITLDNRGNGRCRRCALAQPRREPPSCGRCRNGVIETGNNDLPCDCSLGDTALFNDVDFPGGPVTGAVLKQARRPAPRRLQDLAPAKHWTQKIAKTLQSAPKPEPEPVSTRYDLIDDDWLDR